MNGSAVALSAAEAARVNTLLHRETSDPELVSAQGLSLLGVAGNAVLGADEIRYVHDMLHFYATADGRDLYYGSGDSLHDRLSDVVFKRVAP
jgi:hypothetical protein